MARVTRKIRLRKGTRRTVGITLLLSLGLLWVLWKSPADRSVNQLNSAQPSPSDIDALTQIFTTKGHSEFQEKKGALRAAVAASLAGNNPSSESIAVYLFPDLLPSSDLEREVALEAWYPLQKRIESAPNSESSRKDFEDMRAQIWIYENPDHQYPTLSDTAEAVVKLYDRMSERKP